MTRANSLNGSEWLKRSFSIWRGLGKDADAREHPAPFPVSLAERVLECYASDPQGVVLDPFAGSGSTLIAALRTNMNTVGLDINPEYRRLFQQRLTLPEAGNGGWRYEVQDARLMAEVVADGSVEVCLTSPPYWDILSRSRSADGKSSRPYSTHTEDIGNIDDYDLFLDSLGIVASQVETALRPGGYFILNVMDIRKGPKFYPLHSDAVQAIQRYTTLLFEDIIIWDRQADYNLMRPIGYPHKFIINKVHEYLLVFRRQRNGIQA